MDSALRVVLMLTAIDRASSVINGMASNSNQAFQRMQDSAKKMSAAYAQIKVGQAGIDFLGDTVKAYAEVESATADLKANMLDNFGKLDTAQFEKMQSIAEGLGNKLPGTTADITGMFNALKEGGVKLESILNGTGQATAYLAAVTKQSYETTAKSAAILQNATGVAAADMENFFDDLTRSSGMGVKMDALQGAFSKASAGMKLLGIQGLDASKTMSGIFGVLDRVGIKGQTAGTNMTRLLSELTDPKKLDGMNAMAKQYGITLDFFDKQGKFMGPQNLIDQFNKLQNLGAIDISKILRPLTGGNGMDDSIAKILSMGGGEKIAAYNAEKAKQASLQMKLDEQLKTWNAQMEALQGTIQNAKAQIGGNIVAMLNNVIPKITEGLAAMQAFFKEHPNITKAAVAVTAFASAGLLLNGTLTLLSMSAGGFTKALSLMTNPYVLIGAAVVALAVLIYRNWDAIKSKVFEVWHTITKFFSDTWSRIKNDFNQFVVDIFMIPGRLYAAGSALVGSIWEGAKAKFAQFIAWWAEKIQTIRDYLPFSPAKIGPLRDIHRIKLVETIAGSIKPQPLLHALDNTFGAVAGYGGNQYGRSSGSGGMSPNITMHFHLSGSATQKDADLMGNSMKQQVLTIMRQEKDRQQRTGY